MGKNLTSIYIVRHGETHSNAQGLIQGQSDPSLTENGILQLNDVGKAIKKVKFNAFYTSPLKRALESAGILKQYVKIDPVLNDNLKEQSFGIMEGKPKETLVEHFKNANWDEMTFEEKRNFKIDPTAESDKNALDRLLVFINTIKDRHPNNTTLILTHGTVMRHLLIDLGYATYEKQASVSNGGLMHLTLINNTWKLKEYSGIKFKD